MGSITRFSPVFLLGKAHCGSTLLLRMLGRHFSVLAVGELMRVRDALERESPCTCGEPLPGCPFWSRFLPWMEALRYDWRAFRPELYRRIGEHAGRTIVLDNSKTLAWRMRWCADQRTGYVFMLRDSRGILAAAVREGRSGKDFERVLSRHAKWIKRLGRLAERCRERTHVLLYEDLCEDPEREIRRLCRFLGVEFEPATLRPARETLHLVGASGSAWQQGSSDVRLDERWRDELEPGIRAAVERVMRQVPILRERYLEREAVPIA